MKRIFIIILAPLLFAASPMENITELVDKNRLEDAFELALQLSGSGHPDGDEALGWFYDEGQFVDEDDTKAAVYFRKSAMAGLRHSQWRLGVMLDQGQGVEVDPVEAFEWFEKSAAQDYSNAHVSIGVMFATGRGTIADFSKSMASYRRAAELGNEHGFYGIGILHYLGQGVEQSRNEAAAWMLVAMGQEDPQAPKVFNEIVKKLDTKAMPQIILRAQKIADDFGFKLNLQLDNVEVQ